MFTVNGKYTKAAVMIDLVDDETLKQINEFTNCPVFTNPVAIMPDTHAGKGAVIGFTMSMTDKVIAFTIGVDIACGLTGIKLSPDVMENIGNIAEFDDKVRAVVPMGSDVHKRPIMNVEREFPWTPVQRDMVIFTTMFNKRYRCNFKCPEIDYKWFLSLCKKVKVDSNYAERSIGTLGSGNHFCSLERGKDASVWVVVHSGSRNIGLNIANYWQDTALSSVKEKHKNASVGIEDFIKNTYPQHEWEERLKAEKSLFKVQKDLSYLEGGDMYNYLIDCVFAYHYAYTSRRAIAYNIIGVMNGFDHVTDEINTVHNYVSHEDFIIRKGAVSAHEGERFFIPLNMEEGTLICEGLGNKEWNYSAPHGAGRVSSRKVAKTVVDMVKAVKSMDDAGVYSSVIPADETKYAYKPSSTIVGLIGPTARITDHIRPIVNFKSKGMKR